MLAKIWDDKNIRKLVQQHRRIGRAYKKHRKARDNNKAQQSKGQLRQTRKEIKTLRGQQMETMAASIEDMRIRRPRDFWALFEKKGGQIGIEGEVLETHYANLL